MHMKFSKQAWTIFCIMLVIVLYLSKMGLLKNMLYLWEFIDNSILFQDIDKYTCTWKNCIDGMLVGCPAFCVQTLVLEFWNQGLVLLHQPGTCGLL